MLFFQKNFYRFKILEKCWVRHIQNKNILDHHDPKMAEHYQLGDGRRLDKTIEDHTRIKLLTIQKRKKVLCFESGVFKK